MNSTIFYLNDEKTDFVAVKWEDGWTNTIVYRKKEKIGEIHKRKDLKFGKSIQSSDGKIIYIKLKESLFGKPFLELLIDGNSYDYKEPTTEDKIHKIFTIILAISGINVTLGLLGELLDIAAIDKLGFGYYSVIYGFIFLGLGLAFRFKKSLTSTVVMALMMVLELVYYIIAISHNDINYIIEKNLNGIITRVLLIAMFVKGGIYIIRYKKENSETQTNIAT